MNRRAMPQHILLHAPQRPLRRIVAPFLVAAALMLAACEKPPLDGAAIGGEFALTDSRGQPVKYSDFDGKYRIVYFGYTSCPDVCPLDMQNIMTGYRLFAKDHGNAAKRVVPLFITVDPERDSPAVVGQFAANFGPEVIGLTGSPEAVKAAEKAFAVYAQKRDGSEPDAYLMDHSRAAYLMGPKGEPIALLPAEQSGQAVAAELAKWVK